MTVSANLNQSETRYAIIKLKSKSVFKDCPSKILSVIKNISFSNRKEKRNLENKNPIRYLRTTNQKDTFEINISLIDSFCWWTISPRGYHSPVVTGMMNY